MGTVILSQIFAIFTARRSACIKRARASLIFLCLKIQVLSEGGELTRQHRLLFLLKKGDKNRTFYRDEYSIRSLGRQLLIMLPSYVCRKHQLMWRLYTML
jgi:hypothetical protein